MLLRVAVGGGEGEGRGCSARGTQRPTFLYMSVIFYIFFTLFSFLSFTYFFSFRYPLHAYFLLSCLLFFPALCAQHEDHFRTDKTYTLIQRLAHNVIKTGLRKINSSYSRVSLQDLCTKVEKNGSVRKGGGGREYPEAFRSASSNPVYVIPWM